MQENNFEGKVNEIMEGFTVEPSQAVWQKLQPQIAKREKRKRGIVFLLALLGCLFVGGIFIKNNKNTNGTKTNTINESKATEGNKKSGQNPAAVAVPVTNETGSKQETVVVANEKNIQQQQIAIINESKNYSKKKKLFIPGKTKVNTSDVVIEEEQKAETSETIEQPVTFTEEKLNSIAPGEDKKTITTTVAKANEKESNIVIKADLDKERNTTEKKEEIITVKKEEQKKTNKNNWNLAFNFATGITATSKSYLSSNANNEAKSLSSNDGVGNGSTGSPSRNTFSPSPVKPGLSFTVGVAAIKQLSAKTNFSIGLAYKYASTSVSIGQIIQSASQYSADSIVQGNSNTYLNHYHFIELPVEIQSMIGKGKKLPVYWNAGINTSLLLRSNVLQFQNITGRYYADNSVLNKLQLGITAGLMINVVNKKYSPLLIGPSLYYSVTTIGRKGLYNGTHYSFAGIRIQKQLRKK